MQIGDSVIVIEAGDLPAAIAPWKVTSYVYVEDVDAVHGRASMLGATELAQPQDKPYEERGGLDAAGNTWWVATYKNSPE